MNVHSSRLQSAARVQLHRCDPLAAKRASCSAPPKPKVRTISAALGKRTFACALRAVLALAGCDFSEDATSPERDGALAEPTLAGPTLAETGGTDAGSAARDAASPSTPPSSSSGPTGAAPLADAGAAPTGAMAPSASDAAAAPSPDAALTVDGGAPSAAAGDVAAGAIDAGTQPGWAMREDLGKGDGKDVITIGDSWMDYFLSGGGIQAALDRQGTQYRHYGLSATTLLSGQIPRQYDSAKRENPKISTVIMTGGGNDVMFDAGSCNTKESCDAKMKEISQALDKLWTRMAEDGVKDVVYIAYSEDAGATPKENRGKGAPVPVCLTGKINCHSLATTDLVMAQLIDGIHPTSAANTRIAKALLALMEDRKMRR
ncbi:MAG: hypothetical protein RL385_1103 [Pseudomonadota bacterium]|jgi:lysophospholipase L1-like esterase